MALLCSSISAEFSTHSEIKWNHYSIKWATGRRTGFIIFYAGKFCYCFCFYKWV